MASAIDEWSEFSDQDPKAFFQQQAWLHAEEKRQSEEYEEFCIACQRVARTPNGKAMLTGLARILEYGSSSFRPDESSHLAAVRDGARSAFTEILVGRALGRKIIAKRKAETV